LIPSVVYFAGGIDGRYGDLVSILKGSSKIFEEVARAAIEMWMEGEEDSSFRLCAKRRESSSNGGRVVSVVVIDIDAVGRLSFVFNLRHVPWKCESEVLMESSVISREARRAAAAAARAFARLNSPGAELWRLRFRIIDDAGLYAHKQRRNSRILRARHDEAVGGHFHNRLFKGVL